MFPLLRQNGLTSLKKRFSKSCCYFFDAIYQSFIRIKVLKFQIFNHYYSYYEDYHYCYCCSYYYPYCYYNYYYHNESIILLQLSLFLMFIKTISTSLFNYKHIPFFFNYFNKLFPHRYRFNNIEH